MDLAAIIAPAHEHSYHRTRTLSSMQFRVVDPGWSDPDVLRVAPGATFAFVSGLGGRSIRDQDRCLPTAFPYGCNGEWARIYTSDQSAEYGALFIEFNVAGDPHAAHGYFKNISGVVIDEFDVSATSDPNHPPLLEIAKSPIADAHVEAASPDSNFGSQTTLKVDGEPMETAYLKFDLSDIEGGSVAWAQLRLRIDKGSRSTQSIELLEDVGWDEGSITYNTRPAAGQTIATIYGGSAGGWIAVDVTAAIVSEAGGLLSFAVLSAGSDGIEFDAREAPVDRPELVVSIFTEPAPVPSGGMASRLLIAVLLILTALAVLRADSSSDAA